MNKKIKKEFMTTDEIIKEVQQPQDNLIVILNSFMRNAEKSMELLNNNIQAVATRNEDTLNNINDMRKEIQDLFIATTNANTAQKDAIRETNEKLKFLSEDFIDYQKNALTLEELKILRKKLNMKKKTDDFWKNIGQSFKSELSKKIVSATALIVFGFIVANLKSIWNFISHFFTKTP